MIATQAQAVSHAKNKLTTRQYDSAKSIYVSKGGNVYVNSEAGAKESGEELFTVKGEPIVKTKPKKETTDVA